MDITKVQKRAILIGPLPPPYNGQNMAFGMAVKLFEEERLQHVVINIADRTYMRSDGQFTWLRVVEILRAFARFMINVLQTNQIIYLTNAQTRVGFLRDCIFIWLAVIMRHRIVLHLHGGGYQEFFQKQCLVMQRLIIATLKKTHLLIVVGNYLHEQYAFLLSPKPPITVVHNSLAEGVTAREVPVTIRKQDDPLRILYMSNLIPSKGYLDVLKAVCLLHNQGTCVHVDFCGAFLKSSDSAPGYDPEKAEMEFKKRLTDANLSSVVTYHGIVQGQQKIQLLHDAHVFVLPSYYVNEGQPVSIIEAMANGLVIIATQYRGIVDLVEDGTNGFFVPPRSPESIAQKLEQLYSDPTLCAQMGNASINRFNKVFDLTVWRQALLAAIFSDSMS